VVEGPHVRKSDLIAVVFIDVVFEDVDRLDEEIVEPKKGSA
jgi:hypothetical protein